MRLGISGLSITGNRSASSVNSELIANGTFDTDISGWTDNSESGGSISWDASGYLNLTTGASNLNEGRAFQNASVEVGKSYRVKFTIVSGGGVVYKIDAARGVGSYEVVFTASDPTYQVLFRNFSNTNGTSSIDDVSLKEVSLGPELVTNSRFSDGTTGWTEGDAATTISASGGILSVENGDSTPAFATQSVSITIGQSYVVTVKANSIPGLGSGQRARILCGGFDSGEAISESLFSQVFTATTTGDLILANGGADLSGDVVGWSSASVRQVLSD